MNEQLEQYLEKVEKGLKSLPASERVDIIKEIQSEMLELEGAGVSSEEIVRRLGTPKELARGYLGDAITKTKGFSWKKFSFVLAFYSYAGIGGLFVLPVTSVSAVAFFACGLLCPAAGVIKLAGYFMGYDIPQIQFVVGSYSAGPWAMLPITLVIGAACLTIAWLCWRLTLAFIRSVAVKR